MRQSEVGQCNKCGGPSLFLRTGRGDKAQIWYQSACVCPPDMDYVRRVQAYEAGLTNEYPWQASDGEGVGGAGR